MPLLDYKYIVSKIRIKNTQGFHKRSKCRPQNFSQAEAKCRKIFKSKLSRLSKFALSQNTFFLSWWQMTCRIQIHIGMWNLKREECEYFCGLYFECLWITFFIFLQFNIDIDSKGRKTIYLPNFSKFVFKCSTTVFLCRLLSHDIFFAVKNRRLLWVGTMIADPTRHALSYPLSLFASRSERK